MPSARTLAVPVGLTVALVTLLSARQASSKGSSATLTDQDRADIQALVASYARALATCAAGEYADLFTSDGVFATDGFRGQKHRELYGERGRVAGRAKLMELVQTEEHCLSPSRGDAPGRSGGTVNRQPLEVTLKPVPEGASGSVRLANGGRYEDTYVKTPKGWRFKSRTVFMPSVPGLTAAPFKAHDR